VFRRQPIIDGDDSPAAFLGQFLTDVVVGVEPADDEAAAVEVHENRPVTLAGPVDTGV
jgi:hypothetical protein